MEKNLKRIILGIDISTTCLGISLVGYDGDRTKLLYISHIKPKVNTRKIKGTEALFAKSRLFREQFTALCDELNIRNSITDIVIEEPLSSSQNVGTVNTLLKFNGMISESVYELTGVVPKYISSYDARKFAFPDLMAIRKFNKKGEEYTSKKIKKAIKNNELVLFGSYPFDCAKKMILWNKISGMYENIQWLYDKNGELKTENFDASDSLVCVLGQLSKEKYKDDIPTIISSEEIKNNNSLIINYNIKFCDQIINKSIEIIE